jgi:hypothetical protein
MMTPILLEVIAPMVSGTEMSCRGCGLILETTGVRSKYRRACTEEYPEDWKMASHYLSDLVQSISSLYRHRIRIRLIDAQSPAGLWKQIRHRVFRFPAFVVDQKRTYVGWDSKELESLIDARIRGEP